MYLLKSKSKSLLIAALPFTGPELRRTFLPGQELNANLPIPYSFIFPLLLYY